MGEVVPLIAVITLVVPLASPDDQWRCYILKSQKFVLRWTSYQAQQYFYLEGRVKLLHPGLRLNNPRGQDIQTELAT